MTLLGRGELVRLDNTYARARILSRVPSLAAHVSVVEAADGALAVNAAGQAGTDARRAPGVRSAGPVATTATDALATAEGRACAAEAERDALLRSTSWRVTAPLRALGRLLGRRGAVPNSERGIPMPVSSDMLGPVIGLPATLALSDDPFDVADAIGETVGAGAAEVADQQSALRWIIGELLEQPTLRRRFPTALADGPTSAFAEFLLQSASARGLSSAGQMEVRRLLGTNPAARLVDVYLRSEELRARFPLGLLPAVRGGFARWLLQAGDAPAAAPEEICWFVLRAAGHPSEAVALTYRFTRDWQRRHPDGLTRFGWDRFLVWLKQTKLLPADFHLAGPPSDLTPVEELRLAYHARPSWRTRHPQAFATPGRARLFLQWLVAEEVAAELRPWCADRLSDDTAEALTRPGLNVVGHFLYPSGLRRSAEMLCAGLQAAGGLVSCRDVRTAPADEIGRPTFAGLEPHDVTLLHVQPEPFFAEVYARADLAERRPRTHRVAYWYWETDTVPAHWADVADAVDEVWAASTFVAEAVRRNACVPVHLLPPGLSLPHFAPRGLAELGLGPPAGQRFTILFAFHISSGMARKNPLGLLAAFRAAFRPDEPVDLVLKVTSFGPSGRNDAALRELKEASRGANVHLLDRVLSTEDTLALMAACDAYVSLHRSEGLGLTMAEAMLLGRPVVASRYSGNLDFMTDTNSLLVDGELIPVGPGCPPHDPDAQWFDPSVEGAARHLRRLYEDRAFAAQLGARAQREAAAFFCPLVAGRRVAARLQQIRGASASPL